LRFLREFRSLRFVNSLRWLETRP